MKMASGAYDGAFSVGSRFAEKDGTNPEELIAAAHAGCFSMALSGGLGRAGFAVDNIETSAKVHIVKDDAGWSIDKIELTTVANVAEIDDAKFQEIAEETKSTCPVSKALSAVPNIELDAKLA